MSPTSASSTGRDGRLSVSLRNLASGESSPSAVMRNHASPFAPRPLALIGQLVQSGAREARAPRTRIAFTVGAEKALTSVTARRRTGRGAASRTKVRLVGAVAVQGLGPRHRRDVVGPYAGRRFRRVQHRDRDEAEDVILIDEARFDIELGELELAIGPQVLVAHASRDLVVTIEPADHQELLGDLRALGQHVELPGLQT